MIDQVVKHNPNGTYVKRFRCVYSQVRYNEQSLFANWMKSDTLFKGVSENIIMLVLVLIIYPKYLIECKCFIPLVKNNV